MIHVCVTLLPSCPLLLLSKPDVDEDVILGVAYVPRVSLLLLLSNIKIVFVAHNECCLFRFWNYV